MTSSTANRKTTVTFTPFNKWAVRVIFARDMVRTGRGLGEDLRETIAVFIPCGKRPLVGWLVFNESPDAGTISHEASHAIAELLRIVGARRDEETFAYHLDYLVGRIHKALARGRQ